MTRHTNTAHLDAFVDACRRASFTSDEREVLVLYRTATREHIEAANAAAETMRELEERLKDHSEIIREPGDMTFEWRLDEEGNRLYTQYGRWFRMFLNEARSALESLMFEVKTALRLSVPEIRVEFYGQGVAKEMKKGPQYTRLHALLSLITDKNPTGALQGRQSRWHERYHDLNDARRLSYHRRPYTLPILPSISGIGDEPLRVGGTHILLQDNVREGAVPTYSRKRTVRHATRLWINNVEQIADEVYRLTARILDRSASPIMFASRNRRAKRSSWRRFHRYSQPTSLLLYLEEWHEEARTREITTRIADLLAEHNEEHSTVP